MLWAVIVVGEAASPTVSRNDDHGINVDAFFLHAFTLMYTYKCINVRLCFLVGTTIRILNLDTDTIIVSMTGQIDPSTHSMESAKLVAAVVVVR